MNKEVVLLGSGGHAKVLFEMADELGIKIHAISTNDDTLPSIFSGIKKISDNELAMYKPSEICLINGIGLMPHHSLSRRLYTSFKQKKFEFLTLVSKQAIISPSAILEEGVIIMPGAIVQTCSLIKENTIINTGAKVNHDCEIGKHCHVAPGVTLSGSVVIEDNVHIGTGAKVIQNIHIGDNSVIAAGTTVYRDIPSHSKVMSSAKIIIENIAKYE